MAVIFLIFPSSASSQLIRKSKINFYSSDSLLVTADHYYSNDENPYIILFHTEKSSRGEFDSIADRFVKMNYNCLAVDLRSGDKWGFVENETARRARKEGRSTGIEESFPDMIASVNYVKHLSRQKLFLLGSSSTASLSLKLAVGDSAIHAVMALSPGEFFRPETEMNEVIGNLDKRVFVTGSKNEIPYITDMFAGYDPGQVTVYKPVSDTDKRGTELLQKENPASNEYWLAVLIFIKSFQN